MTELYQTLDAQIDVRKARENVNRVSCLVQVGENSLKAKMAYDEKPDLEECNLKRSEIVWIDEASAKHAQRLVLTSLHVRELIGMCRFFFLLL